MSLLTANGTLQSVLNGPIGGVVATVAAFAASSSLVEIGPLLAAKISVGNEECLLTKDQQIVRLASAILFRSLLVGFQNKLARPTPNPRRHHFCRRSFCLSFGWPASLTASRLAQKNILKERVSQFLRGPFLLQTCEGTNFQMHSFFQNSSLSVDTHFMTNIARVLLFFGKTLRLREKISPKTCNATKKQYTK